MHTMQARPRVVVILDGQYGSCGKGAYAQWLASREAPDYAIRTGGPNAGHSVRFRSGGEWKVVALRHIPAAAVSYPGCRLLLPAAALINVEVLLEEIHALEEAGVSVAHRLHIDSQATIITHADEEAEAGMRERIGSTREGVGAAQAAKIMRTAAVAGEYELLAPYIANITKMVRYALQLGSIIHIEMTQGVGLGLHYGHYPYATSRDITVGQALSDATISPTFPGLDLHCHMLARTYPIRVAGNSGPMGGKELTWAELSMRTDGYVKPERTTVTRLERRVAEWDYKEVAQACSLIRPTMGVISFLDYRVPILAKVAQGAHDEGDIITERAVQAEVNDLFESPLFMVYRRPFLDAGTDVGAVSLGFGVIYPTPAWGSLFPGRFRSLE